MKFVIVVIVWIIPCISSYAASWDDFHEKAVEAGSAFKDAVVTTWEVGKSKSQALFDDTNIDVDGQNMLEEGRALLEQTQKKSNDIFEKSMDLLDETSSNITDSSNKILEEAKLVVIDGFKWAEKAANDMQESLK